MTYSLGNSQPPAEVAEGVTYGHIYWFHGGTTSHGHIAVNDPPSSGWGTAFGFEVADSKKLKLFSPWTLKSWVVPKSCAEVRSFRRIMGGFDAGMRARFVERFPTYYAAHKQRGWSSDFETAEHLMKALGVPIPTADQWPKLAPGAWKSAASAPEYAIAPDGSDSFPEDIKVLNQRRAAEGREALDASSLPKPTKVPKAKPSKASSGGKEGSDVLKKPVKKDSRKGQVLEHFLEDPSISACVEKLGITRSNVLSQLYLLRKDHGIGYAIDDDRIGLDAPEGELFG